VIYQYDKDTCLILRKLDEVPTDENILYGIWSNDLDIDCYDYVVGAIDENHNITWLNPPKAKPTEILINKIKDFRTENNTLIETIAQLQVDDMRYNRIINMLTSTIADMQVDIMKLKGVEGS
jgi:hypothetical protein